ncbi:MAG: hypothetical protein H0U76_19060 [Ktedonobacteraceae bacterium]|nr:hypothetical protein [Ktedonobacteraceae bacterium]
MHTYHSNTILKGWSLLVLLLTACSTSPSNASSSATQKPTQTHVTAISSPPSVPATCQPTPLTSNKADQLPEMQGKATSGELWALFFADPQSIRVGQEVKVVWRMTGSGNFQIVARHAKGIQMQPSWGPEGHGGSSWHRPGDEWGTGFKFSSTGCWNLHATRDKAAGDIWIMVQK